MTTKTKTPRARKINLNTRPVRFHFSRNDLADLETLINLEEELMALLTKRTGPLSCAAVTIDLNEFHKGEFTAWTGIHLTKAIRETQSRIESIRANLAVAAQI